MSARYYVEYWTENMAVITLGPYAYEAAQRIARSLTEKGYTTRVRMEVVK